MARLAIGVDFGGTKVLAAVVDVDSGKVIGTGKKKTRAADGPDELMERIYDTCDEAIVDAKVDRDHVIGIGVGIAGQVDAERGLLLGTANLSRAVVDLPIAARLTERFGVPAALRNDVQIAASASGASAPAATWTIFCASSSARGSAARSCATASWSAARPVRPGRSGTW